MLELDVVPEKSLGNEGWELVLGEYQLRPSWDRLRAFCVRVHPFLSAFWLVRVCLCVMCATLDSKCTVSSVVCNCYPFFAQRQSTA